MNAYRYKPAISSTISVYVLRATSSKPTKTNQNTIYSCKLVYKNSQNDKRASIWMAKGQARDWTPTLLKKLQDAVRCCGCLLRCKCNGILLTANFGTAWTYTNPWCACAARVTVLGLCVYLCLSVCLLQLICDHRLQAIPTASVLREHCFKCCVFPKMASFKIYGVKHQWKS